MTRSALCMQCIVLFFFKQKTAYEMRISYWSSDVCSSDLGSSAACSVGSGSDLEGCPVRGPRSAAAEEAASAVVGPSAAAGTGGTSAARAGVAAGVAAAAAAAVCVEDRKSTRLNSSH